jgi:hypothetical protein
MFAGRGGRQANLGGNIRHHRRKMHFAFGSGGPVPNGPIGRRLNPQLLQL